MNQIVLLVQKIKQLPSWFNGLTALFLFFFIAYLDWITGFDLFILYLIPASLAILLSTMEMGIVISIISLATYLALSIVAKPVDPPVWNTLSASFLFIAFTGINLKLKNLLEANAHLMVQDELTGGLNARLFLQRAEEELHRSNRYKRPITLAYLDCSKLKDVRKEHNFKMEKEILKNIAQIMKSNLRKTDLFTRIDEDNFLILLPEINAGGARTALQKIQSLIRLKSIAANWPLEFNIGAITFMQPPLDMNAVLESVSSMARTQTDSSNFLQHQQMYN
ncbi:MAG: GGDEF domain-containing protein [Calditrichaeota bacterium]|nr:GGDEF domain-containing protein [Calditrichota bacterium]